MKDKFFVDTLENNKPVWKDFLEIFGTALIIFLLINIFLIPSNVHQSSMYPTFKDGDFVIATRGYLNGNRYNRGDIVLFDTNEKVLIKRVIGLPGDKVQIKEGNVYINDRELKEPYLTEEGITWPEMEVVVHEGCYFVMGDNRYNSIDSRVIGEINQEQILGVVRLRVFPNPSTF